MKKRLNILVACEESGRVRDEFIKLGHKAMSCDLLPSRSQGLHFQGDVRMLDLWQYDMLIAFPPCTYLAVSGLHWNKKFPERQKETEKALKFVKFLMNAPVKMIAIENPVGCVSSRIRKPDQIFQPWMFGEDARLKNLPPLEPTKLILKSRYANQTESGQNNLPPSDDRAMLRSVTYMGVAKAMAKQWSEHYERIRRQH